MSHDFFLLIRGLAFGHDLFCHPKGSIMGSWEFIFGVLSGIDSVSEDFRLRHSALLDDAYCTYQLSLPGSTFRDMAHTYHVAYFHILSV